MYLAPLWGVLKKVIERMLTGIHKTSAPEIELNDEQTKQVDAVYEATHELCKAITKNDGLEWNMMWLGEIADIAAMILRKYDQTTHFPGVVTEEDGTQYIEE